MQIGFKMKSNRSNLTVNADYFVIWRYLAEFQGSPIFLNIHEFLKVVIFLEFGG